MDMYKAEMERIAADVAAGRRTADRTRDPGPGYWDQRVFEGTRSHVVRVGRAGVRIRHVPTGDCPSGPCGMRREVITWREPDPARADAEREAYVRACRAYKDAAHKDAAAAHAAYMAAHAAYVHAWSVDEQSRAEAWGRASAIAQEVFHGQCA